MKYRIKVEENQFGEKEFTPQVKRDRFISLWENIIGYRGPNSFNRTFSLDVHSREIFKVEEMARGAIEEFKKDFEHKKKKSTKKVFYIEVN
jgi:hypothetical protein